MASSEQIEKIRQGIMRYRELLDIMKMRVEEGEQAYTQLFADCPPEDRQALAEKTLQWQVAEAMVDDPSPLGTAALHLRYAARELEREFEALHDNVIVD